MAFLELKGTGLLSSRAEGEMMYVSYEIEIDDSHAEAEGYVTLSPPPCAQIPNGLLVDQNGKRWTVAITDKDGSGRIYIR